MSNDKNYPVFSAYNPAYNKGEGKIEIPRLAVRVISLSKHTHEIEINSFGENSKDSAPTKSTFS